MTRPPSIPAPRGDSRQDLLLYADGLYDLARHLTGNPAEADDLVQEAYARAFAAWDGFQPGSNMKAWLFRILRNRFLDGARRGRLHPTEPMSDATLDAVGSAEGDAFLRGDRELERLRGLVGHEIAAALADLSEEHRTVVLLDVEGLTEAEIAAVVGCAPGTVKSRLHRARSALRRNLADYRR